MLTDIADASRPVAVEKDSKSPADEGIIAFTLLHIRIARRTGVIAFRTTALANLTLAEVSGHELTRGSQVLRCVTALTLATQVITTGTTIEAASRNEFSIVNNRPHLEGNCELHF